MGVLRLLYCDSAGVRRCRAVVYKGELPDGCSLAQKAANGVEEAADESMEPMLSTTPSLLEAAAAGVISLFSRAQAAKDAAAQPQQQQQQQQQQDPSSAIPNTALTPAQAASAGHFVFKSAALGAVAEDRSASAVTGNNTVTNGLKSAKKSQQLVGVSMAAVAAAKMAAEYGAGLNMMSMGQPVLKDVLVPGSGLGPIGEVRLVPDLSAVQGLPWAEGHSIAPVDMWERDLSRPSPVCPRSALKRALSALEQQHNIKLLLGFELVFILLKPVEAGTSQPVGPRGGTSQLAKYSAGTTWVPVDESIYCQTSALDQMAPVLDKMVSALEAMDIEVQQYHSGSAPGQFEIDTVPYDALEAVDKLLLSKEVISAIARQHGLNVTFLPSPYGLLDHSGSGCHCHFSLWRAHPEPTYGSSGNLVDNHSSSGQVCLMTVPSGTPQAGQSSQTSGLNAPKGYPTLSNTAAAFLAGVLEHLPGLLPFTAPTKDSYSRLWTYPFAIRHICWGYDNREAPLRVCCPDPAKPETTNVEYKAFEGTANPYIGVTAIIAAGMRGIQEASVLPAPVQVRPVDVTTNSAASQLKDMPLNLHEALAAFNKDNSLKTKMQQLLGPELLQAFLAVRRFEAADKDIDSTSTLLRYS